MAHQQALMEGLITQYKMLAKEPKYSYFPKPQPIMSDPTHPPAGPSRSSTLTLRAITEDNWEDVATLRLPRHQTGNLASNAMSMLTGLYASDAWMRAVYADETLVGFLLLKLRPARGEYYIWRFMLDARYQGLRFGRRVVEMAIAHVKVHYPLAKTLALNCTPKEGNEDVRPEHSPFEFYVKLGFKQVAEPDEDGEVLMEVDL